MRAAQQASDGLQQPSNDNINDDTKYELLSSTINDENMGDTNETRQIVDTPPDCLAH
jgi:hypothetical protein